MQPCNKWSDRTEYVAYGAKASQRICLFDAVSLPDDHYVMWRDENQSKTMRYSVGGLHHIRTGYGSEAASKPVSRLRKSTSQESGRYVHGK